MRINVTKMAKEAHKEKMRPFWEQMDRYETSAEALKWIIRCDILGRNELTSIEEQVKAAIAEHRICQMKITSSLMEEREPKSLEQTEANYAESSRRDVLASLKVFIGFTVASMLFVLLGNYLDVPGNLLYMGGRYFSYVISVILALIAISFAIDVARGIRDIGETAHEKAVEHNERKLEGLEKAYQEHQKCVEECGELLTILSVHLEN